MEPPSETVWVGNLPMESDEASVTTIFAAYGNIIRVSVLPVSNGRGAAIIQLTDAEQATWIVQNLNGNIAQGLIEPIVAKFAKRPSGPRLPGGHSAVAAPSTPATPAAAAANSKLQQKEHANSDQTNVLSSMPTCRRSNRHLLCLDFSSAAPSRSFRLQAACHSAT